MKPIIKELLTELTEYEATPSQPQRHLLNAHKNQDFSDLISCIGFLLLWQKYITLDYLLDDDFRKDGYSFGDIEFERYKVFFHYCPALSEVFALGDNKITFNASLSSVERQEVWEFIHENYKITRRKRRRIK